MRKGTRIHQWLLLFGLLLLTSQSRAQNETLQIRFISNCGLHISDGKGDVYVDFPYRSGAFIYDEFDASELDAIADSAVFLFTHTHGDHYSRKNMKFVKKHKQGKKYGKWNIKSLGELETMFDDFSIKAVRNKHRFSHVHYSFVITWHGKRIFIGGDAESTATVLAEQNLDWAFIPSWIFMSLQEEEAEIDAKMIGIYHIGPYDDVVIKHPQIHVFDTQGEVISLHE